MSTLKEWLSYFGGRGNVAPPMMAPEVVARQPRLSGELAAAAQQYFEPAVYDPMDSDKWPPAPADLAPKAADAMEIVHVSQWQPTESPAAYWREVRMAVAESQQGYWVQVETRNGHDQQATAWSGPHDYVQALGRGGELIDSCLASWSREVDVPNALARDEQPIQVIGQSIWTVTEDGHEVRKLIGQSEQGYHYAVEVRREGSKLEETRWSEAFEDRPAVDRRASEAEQMAIVREDPEVAEYMRRLDHDRAQPRIDLERDAASRNHDDPEIELGH